MNWKSSKNEDGWTTESSWRYYRQSALTTSPQVWRRPKVNENSGIYDNLVSVREEKKKLKKKKKKTRTKVMSPWRTNVLYQEPKIDGRSDGIQWNEAGWTLGDDTSVGSDQDDECTGGFEIQLYPSLTALEVSETRSVGSRGSIGKLSRFLNSMFRRRNENEKRVQNIPKTASCPKNLSTNEVGDGAKKAVVGSPPLPPRVDSLGVARSRRILQDFRLKEEQEFPRRNSESNIKTTDNLKGGRIKRKAPLPPPPEAKEESGRSKSVDENPAKVTERLALPNVTRRHVETRQPSSDAVAVRPSRNPATDGRSFKSKDLMPKCFGVLPEPSQTTTRQATSQKSNRNVVIRKKRPAPLPPPRIKTFGRNGSATARQDSPVTDDVDTSIGSKPDRNSSLDVYATWPEKPEAAKVKVTVNKTGTTGNRWSCASSGVLANTDDDKQMLKIYIPLNVKDDLDGRAGSARPKREQNQNRNENLAEVKGRTAKPKPSIKGDGVVVDAVQRRPSVGNSTVKAMAAAFDEMSQNGVDVRPTNNAVNSESTRGANSKQIVLSRPSAISREANNGGGQLQNSKPPTGTTKVILRRRKSKKGKSQFDKRRLSPLFETNGQKNGVSKEICAILEEAIPEINNGNAMAAPNSIHVNRLFRKLSMAISSGQYERAAILARQLAMLKAQCVSSQFVARSQASSVQNGGGVDAKNSNHVEEKIVSVSLFIEDKDTHHGPIPLNLSPKMSLKMLKKMVEFHFGFPSQNQRWILGKALATEDDLSLGEFGVTQGCSIFLYLVNESQSPAMSRRKNQAEEGSKPGGAIEVEKRNGRSHKLRPDVVAPPPNQGGGPGGGGGGGGGGGSGSAGNYETQVNGSNRWKKVEDDDSSKIDPDRLGTRPKNKFNNSTNDNGTKSVNILRLGATREIDERVKSDDEKEEDDDDEEEDDDDDEGEDDDDDDISADSEEEHENNDDAAGQSDPERVNDVPDEPLDGNDDETQKENLDQLTFEDVPKTKNESDVAPPPGIESRNSEEDGGTKEDDSKGGAKAESTELARQIELEEKMDLIPNAEEFECMVCLLDVVDVGEGVVLRECLHVFCKDCLSNAVEFCDDAMVKCPFRDDQYSCDSHLLDREIKALVPPDVYEKHLQRSIQKAESQDSDSFHCKTPNCTGWCLYEPNVDHFVCPVCRKKNCLKCKAIHEGKNCSQHREDVELNESTNEDIKKTKKFLDSMITEGSAMRCPKCQVVVLKKWGCDWLKCSVCDTEICWVTKGPRWGPAGRGDTSGGCRCRVNGLKCHPLCNYCH